MCLIYGKKSRPGKLFVFLFSVHQHVFKIKNVPNILINPFILAMYFANPLIWDQRVKSGITKTCLYKFDTFKPHFYIVKLGFTGVYIIFLISAQKHFFLTFFFFKELLPVLSSRHLSFKTLGRGAQCSMPVTLGQWQSQTSSVCTEWHGNDQTDLQCQAARHCHHQVQWATCWTSSWRRDGSADMNVECSNGAVKTAFDI